MLPWDAIYSSFSFLSDGFKCVRLSLLLNTTCNFSCVWESDLLISISRFYCVYIWEWLFFNVLLHGIERFWSWNSIHQYTRSYIGWKQHWSVLMFPAFGITAQYLNLLFLLHLHKMSSGFGGSCIFISGCSFVLTRLVKKWSGLWQNLALLNLMQGMSDSRCLQCIPLRIIWFTFEPINVCSK